MTKMPCPSLRRAEKIRATFPVLPLARQPHAAWEKQAH